MSLTQQKEAEIVRFHAIVRKSGNTSFSVTVPQTFIHTGIITHLKKYLVIIREVPNEQS